MKKKALLIAFTLMISLLFCGCNSSEEGDLVSTDFSTCAGTYAMEDEPTSLAMLKQFAMKYYPSESMVDDEIAISGKSTPTFEIEIEHISGKEVQER